MKPRYIAYNTETGTSTVTSSLQKWRARKDAELFNLRGAEMQMPAGLWAVTTTDELEEMWQSGKWGQRTNLWPDSRDFKRQ